MLPGEDAFQPPRRGLAHPTLRGSGRVRAGSPAPSGRDYRPLPPRAAIGLLRLACVWLLLPAAAGLGDEPDPFEILEVASPGRTTAAELADLDGDGRSDLLEIAFEGLPPDEARWLRVRFQREDGTLPEQADLDLPLPSGSAAYEVARLSDAAASDLLLLVPAGVTRVSFSDRKATTRLLEIPGGSVAAGPDERGIDRLALLTRAFQAGPRLVVPGRSEAFLLPPEGVVVARLEVPGRSNYFLQPPGLVVAESNIQIFHDAARLELGDVDGDARTDVVAATRHELRVFLQRPDAGFESTPDRILPLRRVSAEDHFRGSGAVRSLVRDIDGDGRADLVIAELSGGLLNAKATTSIHLNREGAWNLDEPDTVIETRNAMTGIEFLDVDADGRPELLQAHVPVNVFELVEVLLTRAIDAHLHLYGIDAEGRFDPKPRRSRKLGIALSFETGRSLGFLPTLQLDLNADGYPDLLSSGDGSELEIYLGGAESGFEKRAARQTLDTEGRVRGGDLDGDGLPDLVLYNPRRPDAPVRIALNRGLLPGVPPRLEAVDD